jgi:hypothetical protein
MFQFVSIFKQALIASSVAAPPAALFVTRNYNHDNNS